MRSILKYPGAKWAIADWIIGFMPEHHSYLEAFFGSGGVLFNKKPSPIETINDLDGEVVNLFECIQSDPEQLAANILLTPYARDVYESAYNGRCRNRYDKAIKFMTRCNMGHGFRTTGEKVGWKIDIQGREAALNDGIPWGEAEEAITDLQRWAYSYITFLLRKTEDLQAQLSESQRRERAAVEDIKKPSVCDCCKKDCQGDYECIDNGYMYFYWRDPEAGEGEGE